MDLIKTLKATAIGKVPFYLLSTILLMRFIAVFLMGPMPQDAYYFFYSQHPALSYFDHPPAIAYLLLIFTSVLGKNVLAIKLADSFLTILTCLAVYRLATRFFPRFEAEKIIVLFLTTLMVSILSLVSTPDTPLLFSGRFLYGAPGDGLIYCPPADQTKERSIIYPFYLNLRCGQFCSEIFCKQAKTS